MTVNTLNERSLLTNVASKDSAFLVCVSSVVTAVYDSTLNFRNNEMPTLLGVLNGKKYHADLYVR